MKQFQLIVEVVIKDDAETIIVRDPRSGQIVKMCDNAAELASFLDETVSAIKSKTSN